MKTLHAASDRRRPVPLIAAALALVMFSLPALPSLAQVGVTVGPIAGETVGGTTEEHRPLAGGRVMVDMTDNVSIELAIFRFTDQPVEERLGVTVTSDLGITPVQLSARYSHNLVGERFRGFVSGGPGYYFCQDEDVDVEGLRPPIVQTGNPHVKRKNALGWQVAAGLEWLATRNLVVTLEYRFAQMHNSADLTGLSSSTPEGQNAIDDLEGDFEDNDQLGVLDIGVSWRF